MTQNLQCEKVSKLSSIIDEERFDMEEDRKGKRKKKFSYLFKLSLVINNRTRLSNCFVTNAKLNKIIKKKR